MSQRRAAEASLGGKKAREAEVKVKVTGSCLMFVVGIDMNCPLCGVLVESGVQHNCERREGKAK